MWRIKSSKNPNDYFIYICMVHDEKSDNNDLKLRLVHDFSTLGFVRVTNLKTKQNDTSTLESYHSILISDVFIYVMDEDTIQDIRILNEFGTAISYGIPIITVRLNPNFNLSKPLPMTFYDTEIMDRSDEYQRHSSRQKRRPITNNWTRVTIAKALMHAYDTSIVFNEGTFDGLIEKIAYTLKGIKCTDHETQTIDIDSYNDGSSIRSLSSLDDDEQNSISFRNHRTSTLQNGNQPITAKKNVHPSITTKSNGYQPIIAKTNDQQQPIAVKVNGYQPIMCKRKSRHMIRKNQNVKHEEPVISVIPPTPAPPLNHQSRNSDQEHSTPPATHTRRRSSTHQITNKQPNGKPSYTLTKHPQSYPNTNASASETMQSNNQTRLRSQKPHLRRHSSLPVIPTLYMVAPDRCGDSPSVYTYPPIRKPSVNLLSLKTAVSPMPSEDDDQVIHISRACTPVEIETDTGTDVADAKAQVKSMTS